MKKAIILFALTALPTFGTGNETDSVAEDTLRKAIQSAGGAQRFSTIKAPTMWMDTGMFHGMGETVPFVAQYASYWPKRWRRQLVEGQFAIGVAGEQVTLFGGDGDGKGRTLSGTIRETTLHQTRVEWAQLLYPLLDDEYSVSSIPDKDVKGLPAVGLKASHVSGGEILVYFDKGTYLLTKIEATVAAPELDGKPVKRETFYSNHKSFGGVNLPSKYKTYHDGKLLFEGQTTAIKTHATIDPAWFGTEGPARVR